MADHSSSLSDESLDLIRERIAIRDALAQFCLLIDAADYAAVALLFAPDCVTDYGPAAGGRIIGRDAFLDRIRRSQSRFRRTHHQMGQVIFSRDDGGIRTVTYVTAAHRLHDDSRYDSRLQYHDAWQSGHDGWRIRERVTFSALIDDPLIAGERPPGHIRWVPRDPT
jgi:ketosteroid isomerase-like protein